MSVVAAFFLGRPCGRAPGFRGPSLEPFGRPRLGTSAMLPDSDEMKCQCNAIGNCLGWWPNQIPLVPMVLRAVLEREQDIENVRRHKILRRCWLACWLSRLS